MSFKENLKKYAKLTVSTGVNIQRNQILFISAPIEATSFVRMVSQAAFDLGAKDVHIDWYDQTSNKIRYENADESVFSNYPRWIADGKEEFAKNDAAFLSIVGPDPDIYKDVNPKLIADYNKAAATALQGYKKYIQSGHNSWGVVVVPTEAWATKVYPNLTTEVAMDELWNKVFTVTRVNAKDPKKAWDDHIENLKNNMGKLNEKRYKKLFFKGPGTDLVVELPENHIWIGGGLNSTSGTYFVPNMPTEEIFTLPHRLGVNGTLRSTRPLNYGGSLIDEFSFTFKEGKIVNFSAKEGYETLKRLIETDEGASYLGEVALVPDNSPVSNTRTTYFNTLFDENASCHFAIGNAYAMCLENGTKMDKEELKEKGANTSLTHVDFMVGSTELQVAGELSDGTIESIFIDGNWA